MVGNTKRKYCGDKNTPCCKDEECKENVFCNLDYRSSLIPFSLDVYTLSYSKLKLEQEVYEILHKISKIL